MFIAFYYEEENPQVVSTSAPPHPPYPPAICKDSDLATPVAALVADLWPPLVDY